MEHGSLSVASLLCSSSHNDRKVSRALPFIFGSDVTVALSREGEDHTKLSAVELTTKQHSDLMNKCLSLPLLQHVPLKGLLQEVTTQPRAHPPFLGTYASLASHWGGGEGRGMI